MRYQFLLSLLFVCFYSNALDNKCYITLVKCLYLKGQTSNYRFTKTIKPHSSH